MKVDPVHRAMEYVEKTIGSPRYILLTPQGRAFNDAKAERLSGLSHVCLVCGHYEGVDERIISLVDDEISIGDYILSGGEFAALVVIDAVMRYIPGFSGMRSRSGMRR